MADKKTFSNESWEEFKELQSELVGTVANLSNGQSTDIDIISVEDVDSAFTGVDGSGWPILKTKPLMLIFGDSWTDFNAGYANWATACSTMMDCDYISYGVGGASFTLDTRIQDQLTTAVNSLSDADKDRVKYVVVCGGINDARSADKASTSICTAIKKFMTDVASTFPKATCQWIGNYCSYTNSSSGQVKMYEVIHLLEELYTFTERVIYNPKSGFFFPFQNASAVFTSDGLHLNDSAAKRWATLVAGGFGFCDTDLHVWMPNWSTLGTSGKINVVWGFDGQVRCAGYCELAANSTETVELYTDLWMVNAYALQGSKYQPTTVPLVSENTGACTGWVSFQGKNMIFKLNSAASGRSVFTF